MVLIIADIPVEYTHCNISTTVEPLLMDTPYKGQKRNNLHIKDRFNGPK